MRFLIKQAARYPWSVAKAYYSGVSFDPTGQDAAPHGHTFKTDGIKMYISGVATDKIYQYSLSTAWDLSTASYDSVNASLGAEDSFVVELVFKSDGSKLFTLGQANNKVFSYSLTSWGLSTLTYDTLFLDVSGQDNSPTGMALKPDGTKMYIVGGQNDKIYQYSLSTAWDLSTATYDSVSFSLAQDSTPWGIIIKDDGMRMFIAGIDNTSVYEYAIGTAWDISTASYVGSRVIVSSQDSQPAGLTFKSDGARLYVTGGTNDKIYQYTC